MNELDDILDELTNRTYVVVKKHLTIGTICVLTDRLTIEEATDFWNETPCRDSHAMYIAWHTDLLTAVPPLYSSMIYKSNQRS